jgi:hypothetical protein
MRFFGHSADKQRCDLRVSEDAAWEASYRCSGTTAAFGTPWPLSGRRRIAIRSLIVLYKKI